MNETEARELAKQIHREAPHIHAEAIRRGQAGYDESWVVKIRWWSAEGVPHTVSTELEDPLEWSIMKVGAA